MINFDKEKFLEAIECESEKVDWGTIDYNDRLLIRIVTDMYQQFSVGIALGNARHWLDQHKKYVLQVEHKRIRESIRCAAVEQANVVIRTLEID